VYVLTIVRWRGYGVFNVTYSLSTCPDIDPIDKSPFANPVQWTPAKYFHPGPPSDHVLTSSRTRISSPLAITGEQRTCRDPPRKWLTSSQDLNSRTHQEPDPQNEQEQHSLQETQPQRVSGQWSRTIHSLTPVRGLTRPSIPPPFHWPLENYLETLTFSRRSSHLYHSRRWRVTGTDSRRCRVQRPVTWLTRQTMSISCRRYSMFPRTPSSDSWKNRFPPDPSVFCDSKGIIPRSLR